MQRKLSLIVPILALVLSSAGAAQQPAPKETFTAIASNISDMAAPGVVQIEIAIEGWTDDAANERFMAILDDKGQQGLVEAFQKAPEVARLRTAGSLSYPFHYARQTKERDGRRRIILVTDRPIGFNEASNRGISMEYPFTLLDLRVDDSGRGEGQMFYATKFIRTGNLLVLENFATQAIRIGEIRRAK